MFSIFISIFMFVLLVVCGLMTVIILMQKPSANAGMGAALGGGAAESVFGGETANVLLKYTVRVSVVFFVLSFLLYIVCIAHSRATPSTDSSLPKITDGSPASAMPGAAVTSAKTTTTAGSATPTATATLALPAVATPTNGTAAPSTAPATPAASAPAASAPAPASKN